MADTGNFAQWAEANAPSTLGTFLHAFTHGHALQLHAVHRRFLATLAAHTPLLPAPTRRCSSMSTPPANASTAGPSRGPSTAGSRASTRRTPDGHHLHPTLAAAIATVRMRRGKAADSRGAPKFISEALATAREAGCTGMRILRADSQPLVR